jgi:hypothetical protein
VARCATEALINEMREYRPKQLREIARYANRPDYPTSDPEERAEFWKVYRQMVGMHANKR